MTDFLHIISVYKSDTSWIKKLKGKYVLFHKDKPEFEPFNNVNICGAETNTLKYIITFYDNLPDICVFTHPYNNKWTHTGNLYDCINNLYENRDSLADFGSICENPPRNFTGIRYDHMITTNWYNETMLEYFGEMQTDFASGKISGGQFYVKRDTIQRLPKRFYINMFNFLIEKSTPNSLYSQSNPFDQFWTSRFMEWSWEFIFTGRLII